MTRPSIQELLAAWQAVEELKATLDVDTPEEVIAVINGIDLKRKNHLTVLSPTRIKSNRTGVIYRIEGGSVWQGTGRIAVPASPLDVTLRELRAFERRTKK